MRRIHRLLVAVALTVLAPAATVAMNEGVALADPGNDIAVGTALQATSDVTLHKAEIAKGSRVNVTKLLVRAGRLDGVSVALADGHVVKVSLSQLHSFFRIVHD